MFGNFDMTRRYWALTLPFVLGAALHCRWSLWTALGITAVQTVHLIALRRSQLRLALQVRFGSAAMLLIGVLPGMSWIYWMQTAGTTLMVLIGYCPLARMLSILPWNRREPITGPLLHRTFLSLDGRVEAECSHYACMN
jgi:hypothetical protein